MTPDVVSLPDLLAGLLIALGVAWMRPDYRLARQPAKERRSVERLLKTVRDLSAERLELRLAGIYALGRIAAESTADYWPTVEILAAYVRERSRRVRSTRRFRRPDADVQAAVTVLGRLDVVANRVSRHRVDLSRTDLRKCDLSRARLERGTFERARLQRANIRDAYLDHSVFIRARLDGAQLDGASLFSARLDHVTLMGASLSGASLRGADVTGADFTSADLRGADLTGAIGLTPTQVASAIVDETTRFDGTAPERSERRTMAQPDKLIFSGQDDDTSSERAHTIIAEVRNGRREPALRSGDEGVFSDGILSTSEPSDDSRSSLHECPRCSSRMVDRDRLARFAEPFMLKLFKLRSYECLACGTRFYDRPRAGRP